MTRKKGRYQAVDVGAHYGQVMPFRVLDTATGEHVRNWHWVIRRFRTLLAAERHADGLNRGVRRAYGVRP